MYIRDRTHCLWLWVEPTEHDPDLLSIQQQLSQALLTHFCLGLEEKERGLHPPEGEVQDGLDGVSSALVDVSLEPGQQWHHHKHSVGLLLTNKSHQWSAHTPSKHLTPGSIYFIPN